MEGTVLEFTCAGIEDGKKIPAAYTGRGEDLSPEFLIRNLSPKARTLAVTLEDLTHPIKDFTHWIVWNIPAAAKIEGRIPPGRTVPGGAVQGLGYGFHRYAGPKPPRGKTHVYRFTVYALDCVLDLRPGCTKRTFLKRADGHILQKGSVTGEFE